MINIKHIEIQLIVGEALCMLCTGQELYTLINNDKIEITTDIKLLIDKIIKHIHEKFILKGSTINKRISCCWFLSIVKYLSKLYFNVELSILIQESLLILLIDQSEDILSMKYSAEAISLNYDHATKNDTKSFNG